MIINHSRKLLFLAIPRTGSTTFREILKDELPVNYPKDFIDHCSYSEVIRELRFLEGYKLVISTRDIYDRVESLFYHRMKKLQKNYLNKLYNLSPQIAFTIFCLRVFNLKGRLIKPQNYFIKGYRGEIHVLNVKDPNWDIYIKKNLGIDCIKIKRNAITPESKVSLQNFLTRLIISTVYKKDLNIIFEKCTLTQI